MIGGLSLLRTFVLHTALFSLLGTKYREKTAFTVLCEDGVLFQCEGVYFAEEHMWSSKVISSLTEVFLQGVSTGVCMGGLAATPPVATPAEV